ncbi:MAG: cyclic nucleotide-binding domain-containing protein [Myxococcota bacterium]
MSHSLEFEFLDDAEGGQFVPVGGPIQQLRAMLARADVDGAVRLYEETGGSARAELLQELTAASFDLKKSIALMFKRARDFGAAGVAYEQLRQDAEAAPCFEQANDFARAADAWRRAGELTRAAAAFERAGRTDDAVALYGQAGSKEQMAETLARAGRFEAAAAVYRALGNVHAEVESLRACLAATPDAVGPAIRLAELLANHGHPDKGVELLMNCARSSPKARDDAALLEYLARLLEATHNVAAAAKVRARIAAAPKEPQPVPVLRAAQPLANAPANDGYGFLKALPMFADLSLDDMRSLFRVCVQHGFGPGMHLIEPGQPGRGLFVIVDGQVEVFSGNGPDARLLNTLGVGGYVGEISLLLDGPTSARVTARTNVKALFISREAFRQYVFNTPTAALRIYRLFSVNLAERVRTLSAAR